MQTFYFVSWDNGFQEFAKVYALCIDKALAELGCAQFWASVSEEDYVNLRNQEVED